MRRDIVWQRLDRPGLEHVTLDIRPDAVRAEGLVVLGLDEGLARAHYTIQCDGAWRTARADFRLDLGKVANVLALRRDARDRWSANGQRRADLDPCLEIDFAATPLTNTLALMRLDLKSGEPKRMQAAYITVPELAVRVDEQEYTLLSPTSFRYRGISTDFTAEVTMDADRLVVDYPPGWKRRCRADGGL
ncbi:MAG: putative glycolipid-binding domain-containing protein [Alphaproteobacteria bacterium]|nr:putative glycolipid-binding domain-containing protein [Alphaproteobacteria bacterium]